MKVIFCQWSVFSPTMLCPLALAGDLHQLAVQIKLAVMNTGQSKKIPTPSGWICAIGVTQLQRK